MLSTHLAQSLSMPGPAVTMMTGLVRATSTATLTRRSNSLQKIPLQTGCPNCNEGKLAPDQHQEGKRRKDAGPKKPV